MFERKCVKCGNRVFVESKTATKVKCDNCKKSRKVDYDTDDLIYCRICNIARKRLDSHIKSVHDLTIEQYQEQYNGPIFSKNMLMNMKKSDEVRQRIKKSAIDSWKDDKKRKNRIDNLKTPIEKGSNLSEDHKNKISESVKKIKSFAKELTKKRKKQ